MQRSNARTILVVGLIMLAIITVIGGKVFFWTVPHTGAIEESATRQVKYETFHLQARELGLSCWPDDVQKCRLFMDRAARNPELKRALLLAKSKNVSVYLRDGRGFDIKDGFVYVDSKRSDEAVIDFLIGHRTDPSGGLK